MNQQICTDINSFPCNIKCFAFMNNVPAPLTMFIMTEQFNREL